MNPDEPVPSEMHSCTRPRASSIFKAANRFSVVNAASRTYEWTASTVEGGYGRVLNKSRQLALAHRVSWEMAVGPIPKGLHVLHRCDNPPCVRPSHLFLGTQADNVRDMVNKGRDVQLTGESHWKVKLTEAKVREARRRCSEGETKKDLAKEFGVSHSTMCSAVNGTTWKHVT